MFYLLLITIIGVNLAPFVFMGNPSFFWNAQGLWVQVGVLFCFSWSFFEKPKYNSPRNIPLGMLHLWVGLSTAVSCGVIQYKGSYNVRPLLPYFNFLTLVIMYNMLVQYLNIKQIEKVFVWLRYSIIGTLLLCVLQHFGVSQFFQLLYPDYESGLFINNLVSGMIGNGTHLAGFLAMCIPLFLYRRSREDFLALALLLMVLFALTGQTKLDIPISGVIVAFGVGFFYLWRWSKAYTISIFIGFVVIGIVVYLNVPLDRYWRFFHSQGRFGWWRDFLLASRDTFVMGKGFGSVFWTGVKTKYPMHLHNEYIQFLVEGGLIAFFLIVNFIKVFLETPCDKLGFMFKSIFFGFLLSSLFTYPMHLWLPASYACVSYAMVVALKERDNSVIDEKADKGFSISNNKAKCFTDRRFGRRPD